MIDGKKIAAIIQKNLAAEIARDNLQPSLAVLLIGDDPASHLYVNLKQKACQKARIEFHQYLIAADSDTEHVLEVIKFLNQDEHTDAILVQLPLPDKFNTNQIISAISPAKDVDGFHPENIQKLLDGQSDFVPGLALGIIKLLESTGAKLAHKQAVIIANSDIFYKPLRKLLLDKKMSVKIVKKNDKNIKPETQQADVLIAACGQAFFVTADMVKKGVIIIDVGTNKIDNNYIVGDVDYSDVFSKASHITPVPGGVGPMTVAMLLYNTVQLHKLKNPR